MPFVDPSSHPILPASRRAASASPGTCRSPRRRRTAAASSPSWRATRARAAPLIPLSACRSRPASRRRRRRPRAALPRLAPSARDSKARASAPSPRRTRTGPGSAPRGRRAHAQGRRASAAGGARDDLTIRCFFVFFVCFCFFLLPWPSLAVGRWRRVNQCRRSGVSSAADARLCLCAHLSRAAVCAAAVARRCLWATTMLYSTDGDEPAA